MISLLVGALSLVFLPSWIEKLVLPVQMHGPWLLWNVTKAPRSPRSSGQTSSIEDFFYQNVDFSLVDWLYQRPPPLLSQVMVFLWDSGAPQSIPFTPQQCPHLKSTAFCIKKELFPLLRCQMIFEKCFETILRLYLLKLLPELSFCVCNFLCFILLGLPMSASYLWVPQASQAR